MAAAPNMDKSQLRRLAMDYAEGGVDEADYRREKARLIDGITSGEIKIARIATAKPPAAAAQDISEAEDQPSTGTLRKSVPAALGIIVLAVLAWALYPTSRNEEVEPTAMAPPPPQVSSAPKQSPARELVDGFLADNDWTEASLELFEQRWQALTNDERDQALTAPWFRRLATVLRQEVNAQKALAELDDGDIALQKGHRLVAFGTLIGLAGELPDLPVSALEPNRGNPDSAGDGAQPTIPAVAVPPEGADTPAGESQPPGSEPMPPPLPVEPAASGKANDSDAAWFAAQPDENYTLQLYALSKLAQVEKLLTRFPDIDIMLVDLAEQVPRYRILYGSFADAQAARAAHRRLPKLVTAERPQPFVKTFAELRDATQTPASTQTTASTANHAVAMDWSDSWMAKQPDNGYTVQLFASNSQENLARLVAQFPDLNLKAYRAATSSPPFRIVMGSYVSMEAARQAAQGLASSVVSSTGTPLIKRFSDIR